MPGVPSSRGCDACRKQKKKCSPTDSTPPCSRCRRLGITCVGFGQQRFKFKNEGQRLVLANRPSATPFKNDGCNLNGLAITAAPAYGLANSLTRLTSAFVSTVNPSTDLSIQLPWNFGYYLLDIPRRLGTNQALDAASEALVAAYRCFLAGRGVAPNVLIKHSKALVALRQCLDDPVKAYSSETLCSIMVLMIVQLLSAPDIHITISHSVGAAQILKCRGHTGPKDKFENGLLHALRSTVVVEAINNPRITMSKQQWKDFVSSQIDSDTIDGQMMRCLAHLPSLMERGRYALKESLMSESTILELQSEVLKLRESYGPILSSFRERWESIESSRGTQYPRIFLSETQIHSHYSRTYCMALAINILLNCVLVALGGTNPQVRRETPQFSDEILKLDEVVNKYRPLGAMYMIICLPAAWIGATDPKTKAAIAGCLLKYQRDLYGPTATPSSAEQELLEKRITLK
ncbi:uncharacterized protein BP5553_00862 [Venustampulla echinocandica]|uniref:Zn(2)-C6 fungal-type domain-containing protein n=1 Tax=Venustampulla echinocandica TaxID=2656787 RepID=A0A370TZC5_9HELO|nr:uncharacterized protein BP5553_00862 [Venustampulla echinocandica]RDL40883.1 hypothetical protein BP5553_00862 [Venustampulla echinocandica]